MKIGILVGKSSWYNFQYICIMDIQIY